MMTKGLEALLFDLLNTTDYVISSVHAFFFIDPGRQISSFVNTNYILIELYVLF